MMIKGSLVMIDLVSLRFVCLFSYRLPQHECWMVWKTCRSKTTETIDHHSGLVGYPIHAVEVLDPSFDEFST